MRDGRKYGCRRATVAGYQPRHQVQARHHLGARPGPAEGGAGAAGGAAGGAQEKGGGERPEGKDGVIDADFEMVDDNKKK